MATTDTSTIIVDWPEEGVSFNDALKHAPAWAEFAAAPKVPLHRQLASGFPRNEEEDRAIELRNAALRKCKTWRNDKLQHGVLVLQCRDPDRLDDPPQIIPRSMIRYLTIDGRGLVHLPNGRVLCDPMIFSAATLKPTPKAPILVQHEGPMEIVERQGERAHYRHLQELADEAFPKGWRHCRQVVIIKRVTDLQLKRGEPASDRQMILRALGLRRR